MKQRDFGNGKDGEPTFSLASFTRSFNLTRLEGQILLWEASGSRAEAARLAMLLTRLPRTPRGDPDRRLDVLQTYKQLGLLPRSHPLPGRKL